MTPDFKSARAGIIAISKILNKYGLLARVSDPNDEESLRSIFKYHPNLSDKMRGHEIAGFEVHPYKGGQRCFYLCRDDGTKEHFGFQKCIRNAVKVQNNR